MTVVGLDGLILGSNNKAMACFGLVSSCLQPLVGHLMVRIFSFTLSGIAHALVYLPIFVSIDLGHGTLRAFCLTFLA